MCGYGWVGWLWEVVRNFDSSCSRSLCILEKKIIKISHEDCLFVGGGGNIKSKSKTEALDVCRCRCGFVVVKRVLLRSIMPRKRFIAYTVLNRGRWEFLGVSWLMKLPITWDGW